MPGSALCVAAGEVTKYLVYNMRKRQVRALTPYPQTLTLTVTPKSTQELRFPVT